MATINNSNEIKITRIYDAPVKAVWDAWTDPEQVAKWWGPRGFTITTHSKDLRSGGSWTYTMHGPNGMDYPNSTFYHVVEECSRLVYDHGANDEQPALFRVTVNFLEIKGKTKMEMTMTLPTPEAAAETKEFIKKAGGNATWDRLAEFLEKSASNKDLFVINHSFAAPMNVVFDAWTNPEHLARWLPPSGFTMKFIRPDIKEGQSTFSVMSNNDGVVMHTRFNYLEIRRPNRIVYTQQFCDEHENISRHPLAPVWPESMLNTITFIEEGPNETRVTVTSEIHGTASPEEIKSFCDARGGMTQGWSGSFDKLDEYLADGR